MRTKGVLVVFICCLGLYAQNNMQGNVNLQFRFANPGARAQAMGGAFIGLADDTTAIFANPAGLSQLSGSTFVLEVNSLRRENPIPFFGGNIEQTGLQDFRFDLEERDFPDTSTSLPFMAYVRGTTRFKWGVFYAAQADFERSFQTEGVAIPAFEGGRNVVDNTFEFFFPSENFIELKMQSIGVSLGGRVTERLAVGITLGYHDFEYIGNTTLFFPDLEALFPDVRFSPRELEAIRPLIGQPFAVVDVDGDDGAFSVYAGLLFNPSERFGVGLAYKQQPDFDYEFRTTARDQDFVMVPFGSGSATFNVPDSFGAGFSFKPTELFIFTAEVSRVLYSELSDDFQTFFVDEDDPTGATQTVDDVTEYHLGFEYFITSMKYPLALRAGYWFEPYHALKNTNTDTQLLFRFLDPAGDFVQGVRQTAFLQRFQQDMNHITLGLGLSLGTHVVLDLSGDFAEEVRNISLSGIYRF